MVNFHIIYILEHKDNTFILNTNASYWTRPAVCALHEQRTPIRKLYKNIKNTNLVL